MYGELNGSNKYGFQKFGSIAPIAGKTPLLNFTQRIAMSALLTHPFIGLISTLVTINSQFSDCFLKALGFKDLQ